jgi:hypothetical protein
MIIDQLSPAYVGEDVFVLALDPELPAPRVGVPSQVNADYSGADANGGAVLPVEFLVVAPDGGPRVSSVLRATLHRSFLFVPSVPGPHLVLVREIAHNRFLGRLVVDVAGEKA